MNELEALGEALIELDEEQTIALTGEILARGEVPSSSILNACQQAMRVVGERYERQEYYLAGLILAGELFKEVLNLVQPEQDQYPRDGTTGTILLGTVAGDIHDIGKNLFGTALRGFGFTVIDLGVDVPNEEFLRKVENVRPDVVCLSGLITTAFHSMKATTELIRARGPRLGRVPPIVLGGGTVEDQVCRYVGADSWSNDAMEGVRICQRFVERARLEMRD